MDRNERDYAPRKRCGRMRYLGGFCECATDEEVKAYYDLVNGVHERLPLKEPVRRLWRPADAFRA